LVGRRPKTVGGEPPGGGMSADLSHGRISLSFLAEWPEEMPYQVLIKSRSGTKLRPVAAARSAAQGFCLM